MRTSSHFVAKNFEFFEIYSVSTQTRRIEPVRHFADRVGGQFFAIMCGCLLWTMAPNPL